MQRAERSTFDRSILLRGESRNRLDRKGPRADIAAAGYFPDILRISSGYISGGALRRPFSLPKSTMDPNLHQKQAINHLNKVLEYAPFVGEEGRATVHLTPEDWHVVADALFKMDTPPEMIPKQIKKYRIANDYRTIQLDTEDYLIDVERI